MLRKINNKGETIVEVLIALSVLGLTLGLSYGIANRSLKATRDAQERSLAFQYAQSIVEAIKVYTERAPEGSTTKNIVNPSVAASPVTFCLDTQFSSIDSLNPPRSPSDPGRPECNSSIYTSSVTVNNVSTASDTASGVNKYEYQVDVSWDPISGNTVRSSVVLRYRLSTIN